MKMKKLILCLGGLMLASLTIAHAADVGLRPLPGAEYDSGQKKREYKIIPAAQIVKDSPEWIYQQAMIQLIKRDFDEQAKYVSPKLLSIGRKQDESALAGLTQFNPNDSLRIGDFKQEGDSYYACMGFKATNRDAYEMDYHYFLKKDGRWLLVTPKEWQSGKLKAVTN